MTFYRLCDAMNSSELARFGKRAVAVKTGEKRKPKVGEWFLSGAEPHAYKAYADLNFEYYILELVPTPETKGSQKMKTESSLALIETNIKALESFYGMPWTYNFDRKRYECYSPNGVLLLFYGTSGENRKPFGLGAGELLPIECYPSE